MSNHFQFSALLPRAGTRRRLVSTIALGALMLLLAIQPALASSARPAIAQSAPAAATVAVAANADFGDILVDASGMTLYMFDKDAPGTSNCYGGCAERWPPLLIAAGETPVAGEGVTAELGTTERTDGTVQVTANGWPLYYWFEDTAAGDTKGQAVGDVWWVMGPDGTINRTAPAPAEEAAAPAEAPAPAPAPATVAVATNADFGDILVDANGMTLYMFDKDAPGTSNCYDQCAVRWPPLLIAAGETPVAGDGVSAELGTTERTDGTVQVTANGWPLYYWFEDTAAGETKGQAVGDVWWVMGPDGTINRTAPAPAEEAAAPAEAPAQAEAPAATEGPAPTQMPVTGAGGDLLPLAMAGMTLLAGGGWVALRRNKRA
ncbi:MAG: LPXTG cell wall anchor domain-containing protein [Caldilinea sp.]|nr:LPXTG cell wall anchor domain-containing protein [Caldilinea sp.]